MKHKGTFTMGHLTHECGKLLYFIRLQDFRSYKIQNVSVTQ
jgi:hypothetical protein